MQFGIELIFGAEPGETIGKCGSVAALVQDLGFNTLWVPDHVVLFEEYAPNYTYSADGRPPMSAHGWFDPLWALAAAAVETSTLRLGTGIIILPQRNPVILAKEIVALDQLSAGRLELGFGVGWSPEEYDALGVPFHRRGARADEYIAAMTELWSATPATFEGEFVTFCEAVALPKPVQQPRPPVLIGGQSRAALRRAANLGDGWISWMIPGDELTAKHEQADRECEAIGRDPATLRRIHAIAYTEPRAFQNYLAAADDLGAEQVVAVPFVPDRNLDDVLSEIADVCGIL